MNLFTDDLRPAPSGPGFRIFGRFTRAGGRLLAQRRKRDRRNRTARQSRRRNRRHDQ